MNSLQNLHEEFEIVLFSGETRRVDSFLAEYFAEYSRSYIQKWIKEGNVLVNQQVVKASFLLKEGDSLEIKIPEQQELEVLPQDLPLKILYEDEDLAVVEKPQGMVVHPAPGNPDGTLVNALLYHLTVLSPINGVLRPGIVHRIDKNTSGLLVIAKSNVAHHSLSQQLKDHTVIREYFALVEGIIKEDTGMIRTFITRDPKDRKKMSVSHSKGKLAITNYCVIQRFEKHTLVACRLETGRTHQIRVHMKYIGHPLVGDLKYGYVQQKLYTKGQLLHAKTLGFVHPQQKKQMFFNSELPEYFLEILRKIGGETDGYQSCFDGQ